MRKEAEILLRSSVVDVGTYLEVINIDQNVQVEIIRALAFASKVSDTIAETNDNDLQFGEVMVMRTVAARLNDSVTGVHDDSVRPWVEEVAGRIVSFCQRAEAANLYRRLNKKTGSG